MATTSSTTSSTTTSSARVTGRDRLLRTAMRADAVLSALSGAAIVALAGPLSGLTGLSRTLEYAVGVGFVVYGLVVWVLAAQADVRRAGIGVIVANLVYTGLAVAVVVSGVLGLTGAGIVVVLATGVYTALFADLQYLGVRRLRARG